MQSLEDARKEVQHAAPPKRRRPGLPPGIDPDAPRLVGTLIRLHLDGYGFIATETEEYYINISSMRRRSDWHSGQRLSFLPGVPRPGKATPAYDAKTVDDGRDSRED